MVLSLNAADPGDRPCAVSYRIRLYDSALRDSPRNRKRLCSCVMIRGGAGHGTGCFTFERFGAGASLSGFEGGDDGAALPGDLVVGEGPHGARGGGDDELRETVAGAAAVALQRPGLDGAGRPAPAQRAGAVDPETGTARGAEGTPGDAARGWWVVDGTQGGGLDGGRARAGEGGAAARLGGAQGHRLEHPGATSAASASGDGGGAGGV